MTPRLAGMQAPIRNQRMSSYGVPVLAGTRDALQTLTRCRFSSCDPCMEPWQLDSINRACGNRASLIKLGGC